MDDKILRGPEIPIPNGIKSIGEFFFEQADKYQDRPFQIDALSGKLETYKEVKEKCIKLAIRLKKLGLKENDVVMICCQNNFHNIIPIFATFFLGGCVSSVDPTQTIEDIKYSIDLVEPKYFLVQNDFMDMINNCLKSTDSNPKVIELNSNTTEIHVTEEEIKLFKPTRKNIEDTAFILFSSGTTSLPKGICLTHFGILVRAMAIYRPEYDNMPQSKAMHTSSLYYISAPVITAGIVALGGAKVIAPKLTALEFLEAVEKYGINFLFTTNPFTYAITNLDKTEVEKFDLSSFKYFDIGGSYISIQQLKKLREYLPNTKVALTYGSSENGGLTTGFPERDHAYHTKLTSSGKLHPGCEIKIKDLETGVLLGPNQSGQIYMKSISQMSGYYNFDKPGLFDEDGFIDIGDIGYYDEDGYIYLEDRVNEMFKYTVNQVSPAAIEKVLLEHSSIYEAVVFGIPHEQDVYHPAACVVLKDGVHPTDELANEIISFVASKVSEKNQIRGGLKFVESLPTTSTGKIKRRDIREFFLTH